MKTKKENETHINVFGKKAVALHEAAHAVTATYYCWPIEHVSAIPKGAMMESAVLGYCRLACPHPKLRARYKGDDHRYLGDYCHYASAGYWSVLHLYSVNEPRASLGDQRNSRVEIAECFPTWTPSEILHYQQRLWQEAKPFTAAPYILRTIQAFAVKLHRARALPGDQATLLIHQIFAEIEARTWI